MSGAQVSGQVAMVTGHADAYPTLLEGLKLQLCEFQPDLVIVVATLGLAATASQLAHTTSCGHRVSHTRRQQSK